jgi:P-type Cu+ transporter
MATTHATKTITSCYHCGEDCKDETISKDDKLFCCDGCKMVYELLNKNGLCDYYDITQNPGINQKIKVREGKFAFLDSEEIESKLLDFKDNTQKHITFYLPQMHCSSCVWLLEQLPRLKKGIIRSQVNFLRKELNVVFDGEIIRLREIAELLTGIGYEPYISLGDIEKPKSTSINRSRIYKIGIAGFCFGNIMLMSFPEYFAVSEADEIGLKNIFAYINLFLALPVVFYAASDFFISAFKGFKQKYLNIDAPIALAITVTFVRSVYEILSGTGAGYLDSMSGIVFFMLIGRYFQDKTYESLEFDRDYRSYFPVSVTRLLANGKEEQIQVSSIEVGDRLRIHSEEIIPADGILFLGKGNIDYSFVTGESLLSEKTIGELVYAGGKQTGAAIEIEVIKKVSQSYLTQLWNNDVFSKNIENKKPSFIDAVSRYFTYALFSVAISAFSYWMVVDSSKAWNALTAVLIVACPCALLLSATFTNGSMLAKLHKAGFYVKNSKVLENFAEIDTIVFDKTGTISVASESKVHYTGTLMNYEEQQWVRSLAAQSNHPLSKIILNQLSVQKLLPAKNFIEYKGKGSCAIVSGQLIKIGSAKFVGCADVSDNRGAKVFISINEKLLGYFTMEAYYREGLSDVLTELKSKYQLALISGDNRSEEQHLKTIFGNEAQLYFEQSPQEKLNFVESLQSTGKHALMIGDGLNDAGALKQSHVGIVISDNVNNFSPACDVVMEGKSFYKLKQLLDYCRREKQIIYGSFFISILYNILGLFYSVQGELSPVIAAILMPVSSVSIVLFTTIMSSVLALPLLKEKNKITKPKN